MIKSDKNALILVTVVALLCLLPGCASSPATGKKMHKEMLAQDAVYDHPKLQA